MTAEPVDLTTPTIARINHGRGHSYTINGVKVPGVTTILKGGWPAPGLTYWAADEAARYAVEHPDLIAESAVKAYEVIRKSPWAQRDRAAVVGTKVHALAEPLSRGEEVTVDPDLVGYVDAAAAFLTDHHVTVLHSEITVAHLRWSYVGTLDLIADTRHGRMLIDYKTGRTGIWPETALQLAAYRHAEWMVTGDGHTLPMIPVDSCAACWLRPDGYELVPVNADADTFRTFLYCAQVAAATSTDRSFYIGEPLT